MNDVDLHTLSECAQTDDGNAIRFTLRAKDRLLWSKALGWLEWTGARWRPTQSEGVAVQLARHVARAIADEASVLPQDAPSEKQKSPAQKRLSWGLASQSVGKLRAMFQLSQEAPCMTTDDAVWDADAGALNTPAGVLNMVTGALTPHTPSQRNVKITKAPIMPLDEYRDAYARSVWRRFLMWAMRGDESLIEYLQVAVGASLMGDQTCQHIFFCYGGGGNGKGVFDRMIRAAVGDYSTSLKIGFFERKHNAAASDEYALAQLQGARMCVGSEVQPGARFDEAKLKAISGGDPLNARHPYGRPFVIDPPTWVLWLLGNDKPQVTGTDDSIWRRLRLIPWLADVRKTPQDKRIRDLEPRLRAYELPLILRWAQEGAARWNLTQDLPACAAVDAATAEYRESEDYVGRALDELCVFGADSAGRMPTTAKGALISAVGSWFSVRNLPRTQIDRKVSAYMRRKLREHTPVVERRVGSKQHWVGVWVDAPDGATWH